MKTGVSLLTGRRRQISILLTIVAVLLWTHSILYAQLEIGHFGLIHSLKVTFFVALAMLTVASAILWVSGEKHSKLLLIQLLLLINALWLIPEVTGGSLPFMNRAYFNVALINHIAEEGSFSSGGLWYLSWPGAHILFSVMSIVGAIKFEPLLSVFPIFLICAFLLPLYILLRNILGKERVNYCWAGLWIFCLGFWGAGGTFSYGQQIAYFLLLVVLALVISPSLREKDSPKLALLSTVGLLAIAIVPSHLLTSLVLVLMLAAFSVARRTKRLLPIIGLCLVLIVSWDVTGGGHVTERVTSQPLWSPTIETPIPEREEPSNTFTIDPGFITKTEITQHLRGSESHIAVVKVRILHSAIFTLIAIAGIIFVLLFRRKSDTVVILAVSLAPLLLLLISGHYGEELLQRIYLFLLPFTAYFGAMLLDVRSKLPWLILCLLLIIACPTQVISHYGNQALDYFPEAQFAGLKFFDSTSTHGYVTGASPMGYTNNLLQYKHLRYYQLEWKENELSIEAGEKVPYYIAISNQDRAWYGWFWDNYQFIVHIEQLLDNAVNCGLIYSNPVFKLYESDG